MEDDDNIGRAMAEAQDYVDLEVDNNIQGCGKYNVWCHVIAALILSAVIVGLATLGIWYLGNG